MAGYAALLVAGLVACILGIRAAARERRVRPARPEKRANGTMRYHCADGRHLPEGHDCEECPPCLRAQRDGIRKEYEANVNMDLVARLKAMDWHIRQQRIELARLNAHGARPPSPVRDRDAFDAWVMPTLDRHERRFASVAFRAGWAAARRAVQQAGDAPPNDGKVG